MKHSNPEHYPDGEEMFGPVDPVGALGVGIWEPEPDTAPIGGLWIVDKDGEYFQEFYRDPPPFGFFQTNPYK